MFFKVFIIEKTNEKFLLEAAYFFTKNYNTTSYNYRINRLLQIIPKYFSRAQLTTDLFLSGGVCFPEEGTTQFL